MINICKLAVAVLAAAVKGSRAIDTSNCAPLEDLGTNNLDRFDYSIDMDVDDQCSYALSIRMKHDPTLPLPSGPSQCDPALVPPALAPDGLPYFAFRWAYESVPRYIRRATGIDHISIDFASCGHPPVGVFTVPHYDIHVYLVDPPYRSCMTCDTVPGAPVCDPANQSTPSGKGFFNVNTMVAGANAGKPSNMPDGFVVGLGDMVPLMGGHAWDVAIQPNATNPWVDPIWVMGPYDGTLVDYEPMFPLSFVTGTEDKHYEEQLTYAGQTINELPSKYSVSFEASSGYATIRIEGKSAVCAPPVGSKSKSAKRDRRGRYTPWD